MPMTARIGPAQYGASIAMNVRLSLALFRPRDWLLVALAAGLALLVLGVPTAIIDTPLFVRMIPIRTQDYIIWAASAALFGLLAGTFGVARQHRANRAALSGGVLSYLAVGCPICNKVILAMLGSSGALTYFAPVQIYLGLFSLGLLAFALYLRLRGLVRSCALPPSTSAG